MRFEIDRNAAVGQDSSRARFALSLSILAAILLAMLTVAPGASAQASDVYITPDGSGQGVCTSSPHNPAWFNSSGNWGTGAAQIGPGTTVHLCGTFTGSANQQLLSFQGSGANGRPITLVFENGAILQAPYWSNNGAIYISGKSWITVDGGSNGLIQDTANGTGLAHEQPSSAVSVQGSSNVTVKNLTIENMCQHTSSSDLTGCIQGGIPDSGIQVAGGSTNNTIANNLIHDTQTGIFYGSHAGDSGIVISNNTISRINWGIGVGPSGISNSVLITGNDISCVVGAVCNWNTNDGAAFHHNGIMIYPINSGDKVQGAVISNNYIHDINGETTAGVFLDPTNGDIPGVQIYNNVFSTAGGQSGPANAWITVGVGVSGAIVVNNTVTGGGSQGISGRISPTFKNNVVGAVSAGEFLNSGYSNVVSDYNDFYNLTTDGLAMVAGGSSYGSLAGWTAGTGMDTHSISSNPNLTANFTLSSDSPAVGKGTNLTSLGIAGLNVGAPQTFGVNGSCGNGCVSRSTSGPWDLGAYPTGGTTSSQPNPPTSLTALVQ